ncbi:hypothetical protein GE061_016786 [Apolygus lucorum]|uniref:Major facilitator superfamily (MFS) profile domain-containing protein n=1 Tax=Apolygus lucorum TaxID=248454 RepID=A0A8S9XH51_APOLU|nr:hypothetical protein GE061_016786 [Apolygus lucorum]
MVSLAPLNAGMIVGWISPISLKLMADDSPVGVMTKEEISRLASCAFYALMVYAFALSYVSDKFGRKPALIMVGIPNIVSGTILTFATSKTWLYIGRTLSGLRSNGIFMSAMYLSEIADGSIRGMVITLCSVQINIGILVSYIAGKALSYKTFNAIMIVLPTIFSILMMWLPESPPYLLSKGKKKEAKKTLLWLRAGYEAAAQHELEAMKQPNAAEAFISTASFTRESFTETFKTRGARRALIISSLGFLLQMFSGINLILSYAGIIFKEAGSPMTPEDSSIIVAVIILVSSIINLLVVDRLGRKPLLYVSYFLGAITMATLSVFLYVQMIGVNVTDFRWIPIASIGVYVFSFAIGLSSIPGVIMNEVCSPIMKPTVLCVNTVSMVISISIVLQSFPYLDEYLGLYSTFVFPVFVNIFGLFFTWYMIPETKGKTLAQITCELNRQ